MNTIAIISSLVSIIAIIGGILSIYSFMNARMNTKISAYGLRLTLVLFLITVAILIATSAILSSRILPVLIPSPVPTSSQPATGELTPQEVQKWCSPIPNEGTCDLSRFEQLPLVGGGVDPNAVHMKAGGPVKIKLPQGFTAIIWDCYKEVNARGPTVLSQVCEMKVWKSP